MDLQFLLSNKDKLQPHIDEFMRTQDGINLQKGIDSLKQFIINKASKVK